MPLATVVAGLAHGPTEFGSGMIPVPVPEIFVGPPVTVGAIDAVAGLIMAPLPPDAFRRLLLALIGGIALVTLIA